MRLLLLFILLLSGIHLQAQIDSTGHFITCWFQGDTVTNVVVPAPASVVDGTAEMQTQFDVVFTDSVPQDAEASIRFAAEVWGNYLTSSVPIRVEVGWEDQGDERILASAGPTSIWRAFDGSIDDDVWYPVALAEAILGVELNDTSEADINVVVNSTANWNYGTEGSVPRNRIDLASVILHELGHGLGFLSSIDSTSDTTVSIGFDKMPIIYDIFLETPPGRSLVDTFEFRSPSPELLAAVIDRLEFAGDSAVAKNDGELVPLFAPETFDIGSSVSHLDERTYRPGNRDALMTPSIASGEAIRDPGPVTLGLLFDLGWPLRFELVSSLHEIVAGRLSIFPNPAAGAFTVELDERATAPTMAYLYGADGREVHRQPIDPAGSRQIQIEVQNLPPGIYTLLVPDGARAYTGRVMLQ